MIAAESAVIALLVFSAIWDMLWKGIAMWRAARNGHSTWFIFLFFLSTLGLLPIIYIAFFSKFKWKKSKK
jgi:hypothetical protein